MKSPDTTASGANVLPLAKGLSTDLRTPYGNLAFTVKDAQAFKPCSLDVNLSSRDMKECKGVFSGVIMKQDEASLIMSLLGV